jgi:hypothetical protein
MNNASFYNTTIGQNGSTINGDTSATQNTFNF